MVTLVRAPNPSAMTLTGTNSYLIDCGAGQALVIDPGPNIEHHVHAIAAEARAKRLQIAAIAITHGHPDHAPAAAPLATLTGAPVYAHPTSRIQHDRPLELEGTLHVGNTALQIVDAPGHTFDHVAFYLPPERALFTGDVILGEGSVVIAPPGGAMRPYQATLERLATEFKHAEIIHGGHGPVVLDAQAKIAEYIEHRKMRERELIDALALGPQTIPELVLHIYGDDRPILWPAMARQMLAHLIALEHENRVHADRVQRAMSEREEFILNPPLEKLVSPEEAEVIAQELGSMLRLDALYAYKLKGG